MNLQLNRFCDASNYYSEWGYQVLDVPWLVEQKAINITLPNDATGLSITKNQYLVGSAEQSFIQMMFDKKLVPGMYQAFTPCYRSDKQDELHQTYFNKLELMEYYENSSDMQSKRLDKMIKIASYVYEQYLKIEVIPTIIGYDIVDSKNKIELGSYGIRGRQDIGWWIYGTGLAEPRLSIVMSKQ